MSKKILGREYRILISIILCEFYILELKSSIHENSEYAADYVILNQSLEF